MNAFTPAEPAPYDVSTFNHAAFHALVRRRAPMPSVTTAGPPKSRSASSPPSRAGIM